MAVPHLWVSVIEGTEMQGRTLQRRGNVVPMLALETSRTYVRFCCLSKAGVPLSWCCFLLCKVIEVQCAVPFFFFVVRLWRKEINASGHSRVATPIQPIFQIKKMHVYGMLICGRSFQPFSPSTPFLFH